MNENAATLPQCCQLFTTSCTLHTSYDTQTTHSHSWKRPGSQRQDLGTTAAHQAGQASSSCGLPLPEPQHLQWWPLTPHQQALGRPIQVLCPVPLQLEGHQDTFPSTRSSHCRPSMLSLQLKLCSAEFGGSNLEL